MEGNHANQQNVTVMAAAFSAKFSNKREIYNFLTLDCHAFLPHYQTVTIYFVSACVSLFLPD